jgi:transposase
MRYELSDDEWTTIKPMLPNKPRGVPRDAAVQMIDTSIVRVHQHGACITRNRRQSRGRSRGGLTSKIHALVDTNGLPVRLALTAGEAHDNRLAGRLLSRLKSGAMLLADRGYDPDWIRRARTEDVGSALRLCPDGAERQSGRALAHPTLAAIA